MRNNDELDFVELILLVFIAIIIVIFLGKRSNKSRCYNLPVNDFYKDSACKEYWNSKE